MQFVFPEDHSKEFIYFSVAVFIISFCQEHHLKPLALAADFLLFISAS
jgi:hypothetical protein